MSKNRRAFFQAGLGIFLLWVLCWYFGIGQIARNFGAIDPSYLILTVLLIGLGTLLGAANVYLLLEAGPARPRFRTFLPVYWTSWAIGLIFPGQVGDVASLALLLKRHGLELHATLARSAADKAISLMMMSAFGLYGISRLPVAADIPTSQAWSSIAAIGACLLAIALGLMKITAARFPAGVTILGKTWREMVALMTENPLRLLANMGLTMFKIVIAGATYLFMFRALGQHGHTLTEVTPLVAASSLVAYLPVSLNGLGTAEAMGVMLFAGLKLTPATVLASYLALRISGLLLAWIPTLFLLSIARECGQGQALNPRGRKP